MAYLAWVEGRPLRLDVVQARDGTLIVEVSELAERSTGAAGRTYRLEVHGARGWLAARLETGRSLEAFVERRSGTAVVWLDGVAYHVDLVDERAVRRARASGSTGGPRTLTAPMPGKIVKHLVAVGDRVEAGQGVIVVEAMKMENELRAPAGGVVKALPAAEGTAVDAGAPLVILG
jgi:biotin carboxyl carrier protein